MSELAERVTEAVASAKKNGYSVSKIAAACGVSRQSVYQWANGETHSIEGKHLVELAEISGCSARWIISGKGSKNGGISSEEMTIVRGFRLFGDEIRGYWLSAAIKRIKEDEASKKGLAA